MSDRPKKGQKRFFFHFNKHTGKMTVHYNKQCLMVDDVVCTVPCHSKWNKEQPRLVMQGWCDNIIISSADNKALIM